MNTQTLDINIFNNMSIDNIIFLYKQGYKLEENNTVNNNKLNSLEIKKLSTCGISTIVQGTNRTVYVNPSGGTPPYTSVQLLRDGIVVASATGAPFNTVPSGGIPITYNFPILGNTVYKSQVVDSCSTGTQTSQDITGCTINVTAPIITCPSLTISTNI